MHKHAPTSKPIKTAAPPAATPAMVPVDIFFGFDVGAGVVFVGVGVGISLVGVREATTAFWAK